LENITANRELYAIDVDRRVDDKDSSYFFPQLVGQEDGGVYVTRKGAVKLSEIEPEEAFEGYRSVED